MNSPLAALPKVDKVALHPDLERARTLLGHRAVVLLTRRAIDGFREAVRDGRDAPSIEEVVTAVEVAARRQLGARSRPVINATGVVVHTNLGRAPLAPSAVEAVARTAGRYTNLELDLTTGRRGGRGAFAEAVLAELAGAEAALVVNNNAAAVLLALGALVAGKAVIVSRGELVEIGGGFRIPEVCERSGAKLVEVGTTNKTRLSDYARALDQNPNVGAILRVHQANFRQTGFVERPPLDGLAELAKERGVVLVKDLGGGATVDLGPAGLPGEPVVAQCISAGCDVVCFSTDKVLGGPQGGAIVGRAALVEKTRRDPLARALRLGRLPLAALEATLQLYREGREKEIPVVAALRAPLAEVEERAGRWKAALAERGVTCRVVRVGAAVGGGALADVPLASAGVAIATADPDGFLGRLRDGEPAVLARIADGDVVLDARTVLPGEDEALLTAVARAAEPEA